LIIVSAAYPGTQKKKAAVSLGEALVKVILQTPGMKKYKFDTV